MEDLDRSEGFAQFICDIMRDVHGVVVTTVFTEAHRDKAVGVRDRLKKRQELLNSNRRQK